MSQISWTHGELSYIGVILLNHVVILIDSYCSLTRRATTSL